MADTKQEILEVARRLFTELGYEHTPLRAIADELGITKAALYYHYPSKDSLLEAMLAPAFSFLRDLVGRFDAHGGAATWIPLIDELVDWSFAQQPLLALLERNHDTIERLLHEPDSFMQHQDMHDMLNTAFTDDTVPRGDRLRLVAALGVASAMFTFGSSMLGATTVSDGPSIKQLVRAVFAAPLG